ncbi:MAG: hypothetical protein AB7F35_15690 [Acetobacteraceae bacterium]
MPFPVRPARRRSSLPFAAALILGGLSGGPLAWADQGKPDPAPRSVVEIGDASIVLVSTEDKLLAFVDRLHDNAPLEDATLTIRRAGKALTLEQASSGLFVAPLDRMGRLRDAFTVSLQSGSGTGSAETEIIYRQELAAQPAAVEDGLGEKLWIALVGAALGATGASLTLLWARSRRRVGAGAPARAA